MIATNGRRVAEAHSMVRLDYTCKLVRNHDWDGIEIEGKVEKRWVKREVQYGKAGRLFKIERIKARIVIVKAVDHLGVVVVKKWIGNIYLHHAFSMRA